MYTNVTTTITTAIDLETFEPKHSVDIAAEEGLPQEVIYAAAVGGAEAAARTIREANPRLGKSFEQEVSELANEEFSDTEFRQKVVHILDGE